METRGSPAVSARKASPTPKAVINQKFGSRACYKVEEVLESENGCPGLAVPQKGPCLFRCSLELPEFSVMSDVCRKKKDAEQSAAGKALEKLGINPEMNCAISVEDPWDSMVLHLAHVFSDEFVSAVNPLSGHFRAALQRECDLNGFIPVSVMVICDSKLSNLCKSINPKVESNPLLAIPLIIKAATRLSDSISTSEEQLWMRRQSPYPSQVIESLIDKQNSLPEGFQVEAVHIPYELENAVEPFSMNVPSNGYYLDVIARELCVTDASKVLASRGIGKTSSEMRLYFCTPVSFLLDPSSGLLHVKEAGKFEGSFNVRASYLSGQDIYGNAILASIGYTWKSKDLYHEDVSMRTYYRLLISKMPSGLYKLSREATLAADLPLAYTTRPNWKGSAPRDLLFMFCRQHHLSEPVFSLLSYSLDSLLKPPEVHKGLTVENGAACSGASGESQCTFRCEVKIFSKSWDLIVECVPKDFYKKQNDAVQNAALKVLSWLNSFFKEPDMPLEKLIFSGDAFQIQFNTQHFLKVFALCSSVHKVPQRIISQEGRLLGSNCMNHAYVNMLGERVALINIEGPDSGVPPVNGSLVCIRYTVSLVTESENTKHLLESRDDFEFEIGTGSVIPHLEAGVTQLSMGQCACFMMELDAHELILAAAGDSAKTISLLSSKACCLEYSFTLLKVTEPLEDRMEQAFFSPPLSKQRVEFALRHIKESSAKTLIDFGCGSGSLLCALLNYPTALEKIVGVDISQKGLIRAAKIINPKLSANLQPGSLNRAIQSAVLYEGSITDADSRLYGFDIGTCLEVIEHMEEDQACLFGDVVLSYFCPRILIVSTPNYEYNVILQSSNPTAREDDPDGKTPSESCKFRNHDHKFEWTRDQFNCWATDLARRHNYSVEFSGVGGSGDLDPGFASQIAVFRSNHFHLKNIDLAHRYEVIWEWTNSTV